ncbi:hypothetical protein HDU96_004231, partial [Phlyctochytrium bullatum]
MPKEPAKKVTRNSRKKVDHVDLEIVGDVGMPLSASTHNAVEDDAAALVDAVQEESQEISPASEGGFAPVVDSRIAHDDRTPMDVVPPALISAGQAAQEAEGSSDSKAPIDSQQLSEGDDIRGDLSCDAKPGLQADVKGKGKAPVQSSVFMEFGKLDAIIAMTPVRSRPYREDQSPDTPTPDALASRTGHTASS